MNIESRIRSAKRIAGLALATAAAGAMLLPAAQANASTGEVAGAYVVMHEKPILCKHRHKCGHRHHRCHRCGHRHHHHHCKCHRHHHDRWHDDKYKDDHDHHDDDDHRRHHDSHDKKKWDHYPHSYKHHDLDRWWDWPNQGNSSPWWRTDENNRGRA